MRDHSTRRDTATRPALVALVICFLLALLAPAQASSAPTHPRNPSLDIEGLNHACGVAVDTKGNLYASSAGESKVKIFNAAHTEIGSISNSNEPCGLAVDTDGNLYLSEKATGNVLRYHPTTFPSYEAPTTVDASGKAKGIAVDRFDDRLYVAEGTKVAVYNSEGAFETNVGEGTLTEASGVAAYSYPWNAGPFSGTERYLWVADAKGVLADRLYLFGGQEVGALKLRKEVNGATTPDGSFGFGAAGAYLAQDSGNRDSEGKCVVVGGQACTSGHLFLYDALHKALDEFDGSGEYLGRTAYAGFADAEPTAIAIDRSGGAGDGTLYVTAGAGAGAKALAFGPLKAPSRKTLKTPEEEAGGLSHILEKANAVATDSRGDVYASANSEVRIYGPSGASITTIEDPGNPIGLAVDSTGKVYVLDANGGSSAEFEVTYFTPSKYPPDSGTKYTRHEPAVAVPGEFPSGSKVIKAIALNPGPGPGKDQLFVTGSNATRLYKSAAEGSGLLVEKFAPCVNGIRQSIAVDGARGVVYIAPNPHVIYAANEAGTECLGHIENTGSAKVGVNPRIAVDQANGHLVEFDSTTVAREYDAAGGFVAAFGTFTEKLDKVPQLAVDNACALHEPPLTETTTPTCKEFDPANGTAYIAWDDLSPSNPPYDVNAFGPLTYPESAAPTKYKLTVKKTGTGSGKVTSSPVGIDCGAICSAEFEEGTEVTLEAKADGGSTFAGWSGSGCSGTGKCEVTMSAAKEVTAEFNTGSKPKFLLKVNLAGSGTGTVTSSPAGINCGLDCTEEYEEGTKVTLTGAPGANTKAVVWSGCGTVNGENKCEVTMSAAKEVIATFSLEQHQLSVSRKGTGTGTVTSAPTGINCGSECSALYDHGTAVTLTGTSGAKTKVVQWSGCDSVNGENKCLVTISTAKSVTATFDLEPTPKFLLKVNLAGSGTGTVTSSPAGINCGLDCEELYEEGTPVTLTGTPGANTKAVAWSGCDSVNGENKCLVTMTAAKEVTATFALEQHLLTVKKTGTGTGKVTGPGIDCGSTCSASFDHGTEVTLSASADAGSEFKGWSGSGCSGTGTCKVTMTEAREVTATFDKEPKEAGIPLTVALEGTGTGTVSSDKGAISCGAFCSDEYPEGTVVVLTATPAPGSIFVSWKYCDKEGVNGRQCTVTVDKAKTVKAVFTTTHALEVSRAGSGLGKVQSSPGGILCLSNCSETTAAFKEATKVTLKQTPAKHFHFVEWLGDCTGSTACTVTMGEDHSVQAEFAEDPKYLLTLTKTGGGQGTVKSSVAGINCGAVCSEQASAYYQGEVVELTQTPGKGSDFKGWSGACSGIGACTVTMSEAKEVTAKFE